MDKRLLSRDPLTGLMTYHSYDDLTDTTIISYEADSSSIIETNKKMANDDDLTKEGMKDGFWLYATIPAELEIKWLINEGLDIYNPAHSKRLFAKLADPEYKYLKCTTGKHLK